MLTAINALINDDGNIELTLLQSLEGPTTLSLTAISALDNTSVEQTYAVHSNYYSTSAETYDLPDAVNDIGGTKNDDTLTGTNKSDYLFGKKGDDILEVLEGDDLIRGGSGKDMLIGSDGNNY